MKNEVIINNQHVGFEVVGDQTYTTSLSIAQVFEKQHKHIIAKIEEFPNDEFNALNFQAVKYQDKKGELRPCYNLTRDGFALLVMGFTGKKAYKWKIEYINAFNLMEKELLSYKHQNILHVTNGYKSQIAQKNKLINELKAKHNKEFVALYEQKAPLRWL